MKKQIFNGVKWTTASTVISALVSIVKISILARLLNKADFGLVAIVSFILGFMNMFMDMGIAAAILHKQNISQNQYNSLYSFNILAGLLLYGVICLLSTSFASFYNENELGLLIPIMGLNIIFASIGLQHKIVQQKELNFRLIASIEMISLCGSLIIAVWLALQGYGVYSLVYSSLFQYGVSNIIFAIYGFGKNKFTIRFRYKEAKPFLRIGIYQVGGQMVNFFNKELDVLIIGKLLGAEILGGYHLAKQLAARPVQIINPVISKIATPALAKFQFDNAKLKQNYLEIIKLLSFINFPIYFGMAVLGRPIITLFYGESFLDVAIIFQVLCFYMMLRSIGNPIGTLLIAKGRTDLDLYWNLLVLGTMPIVTFFAAKHSILFVALSQLIMMILFYIPSWRIMVFTLISASLKEYFSKSIIALIASSFMALVVFAILSLLGNINYIVQIFVGTLAGVVTYGSLVWIMSKFIKDDIMPKFNFEV